MAEAVDASRSLLSPWPDQVKIELLNEAEFEAWSHPQDYTTVTEAAARLGVSRQSVLQRIQRGTLPARRKGRRWAVPWAALS
ncbi:MAG: helix-turn-helix domain-containing protein [Propionibacteriaceae bacterium]|nr:helix-turn-helix domain-containing protein [Propionibacteriaceae bacterium]